MAVLSREFLNFRRVDGAAKFRFAAPDDPAMLDFAGALDAVAAQSAELGLSRGETEAMLGAAVGGNNAKFEAGMIALIGKRLDFTPPDDLDYPAMRAGLFARSSELLKSDVPTLAAYRTLAAPPECDIYGDLPDNERCTNYRRLTPPELLNLYNVSQVQTLLCFTEKLVVRTAPSDPAKLRNLFKHLKFCRLLAEVDDPGNGKPVTIVVSGPLAMFSENRKYALQLAAFFPEVLNQEKWSLSSVAKPPAGSEVKITLNWKSGLRPVSRRYATYIPEEFAMFAKLFREKNTGFALSDEPPHPVRLHGGETAIPDFEFISAATGKKFAVELFHRHHATALNRRLEQIKNGGIDCEYILGIDRYLTKNNNLSSIFDNFSDVPFVFFFSGFPGVDRVARRLAALDK